MKKATQLSLAAAASCLAIGASVALQTLPGHARTWATFHYYLGGKYLPELGYRSLYTCSLRAAGQPWETVSYVRDLHTYRIVPRADLPPCPVEKFSPERWGSFVRDVAEFSGRAPAERFAETLTDKGFNATPVWAALAGPLARAVPLNGGAAEDVAFNLDLLAALAAVALVWRERGARAGTLTGAAAFLYFGTLGAIGGGFLQHLWLPLLAGAVYLWRRGRPLGSGVALGAAAGLQVFPLAFALPMLASREPRPARIRFAAGLAAAVVASLLVGSLTPAGPGAWVDWGRKIADHAAYIRGEVFNVGLANLVATVAQPNPGDAASYLQDEPHTQLRNASLSRSLPAYLAALAVLLALVGVALRRTAGAAAWLGFPVAYGLLTLSPYYYLSLALLPYLAADGPPAVRRYATWGTAALLLAHLAAFGFGYISFGYLPHLASELAIAAFTFGLAGVGAWSSLRRGR